MKKTRVRAHRRKGKRVRAHTRRIKRRKNYGSKVLVSKTPEGKFRHAVGAGTAKEFRILTQLNKKESCPSCGREFVEGLPPGGTCYYCGARLR